MRSVLLLLLLSIPLSFAAACSRAPQQSPPPATPPPAATPSPPASADPVIAQLEAELAAEPSNAAVIYALAMFHDRRGRVPEALGWLEKLAGTAWDAGVDPADFVAAVRLAGE